MYETGKVTFCQFLLCSLLIVNSMKIAKLIIGVFCPVFLTFSHIAKPDEVWYNITIINNLNKELKMLWILIKFLQFKNVDKGIVGDNFPKQYSDKRTRNGWIYLVGITALYVSYGFSVKTGSDLSFFLCGTFFYAVACKEFYKQYIKKEYKLFRFNKLVFSEKVRQEMDNANYRPTTLREMLVWNLTHRDKKSWIIGLGQSNGNREIPVIDSFIAGNKLKLECIDGAWGTPCAFLAVKK